MIPFVEPIAESQWLRAKGGKNSTGQPAPSCKVVRKHLVIGLIGESEFVSNRPFETCATKSGKKFFKPILIRRTNRSRIGHDSSLPFDVVKSRQLFPGKTSLGRIDDMEHDQIVSKMLQQRESGSDALGIIEKVAYKYDDASLWNTACKFFEYIRHAGVLTGRNGFQ